LVESVVGEIVYCDEDGDCIRGVAAGTIDGGGDDDGIYDED
jgi:hypothetical protein